VPIREALSSRLLEAGSRLRVRSALNPILWLAGIVSVPAIIAAARYPGPAPAWLIVLAYLPVCAAVIGFLYLLIFDRDKLQSEDYQLRKRSLDLIQQKGDAFPLEPTSVNAITNPERPRLTSGEGESAQ
jgi:hypothetical protein